MFASTLVVFPLPALRTFNIVFLAVVPVIVILLILGARLVRQRRDTKQPEGRGRRHHSRRVHHPEVHEGKLQRAWRLTKTINWTPTWLQFWVALLISVGAQVGLVAGYAKLNPYVSEYIRDVISCKSFLIEARLSTRHPTSFSLLPSHWFILQYISPSLSGYRSAPKNMPTVHSRP